MSTSAAAMPPRPLDQIRKENKEAHRAYHLRKGNMVPTDEIDSLDNIMGATYHHDGPYDATLAARNQNVKYAPVNATSETNKKALKATPYENVQDSLKKHVPLHGTANIPPGLEDYHGNIMDYEEGADLMREPDAEGGPYRRYQAYGIEYHPDDLKGKAEPQFTIDRHLKGHKHDQSGANLYSDEGAGVYEMSLHSPTQKSGSFATRQRSLSSSNGPSSPVTATSHDSGVQRSRSTSKPFEGLKRRIGSLRRKSP